MTFDKTQTVELMKEFLSSNEWQVLRDYLDTRWKGGLDALKTTTSMDVVFRLQAQIREDEYLLNLPKNIIKEVQNGS